MIYQLLIIVCLIIGISVNLYSRSKRLEWYSSTDAFYLGFISLLLQVFLLGFMFNWFVRNVLSGG